MICTTLSLVLQPVEDTDNNYNKAANPRDCGASLAIAWMYMWGDYM